MDDKPTIIIVDDDPAGRESICGFFISQGYHLLEAADGPSAIALAKEHIPDLILLDVMMPGMDGFEVCRVLRQDPVLREIPILMVTALDDRESRLAGIEAGADDFISKPLDRVELRARVRSITRLNRYRHLLLERARFLWVIENDQDSYVILDDRAKINYANQSARLLFGLSDEEAENSSQDFLELVADRFACVPPESWTDWAQMKETDVPLMMIQHADEVHNPQWLEVRVLDLPWITRDQRLVRIQDVTKTMALTMEIWSFQAAATHKMITPLSNMSLSLDLMRMLIKTGNTEELLDYVQVIQDNTKRLEAELKDILQYVYAPSLAGGGSLLSLRALQEMTTSIAADVGLENPRFSVTGRLPDPDALIRLTSHAYQIVLWELFENAKKFHPALAPLVEINLSMADPTSLLLRVSDNGGTLSAEQMRQAFTPYYQGEKQFTGEVSGMGLGLSTVAALIWQVGGALAISNRSDGPGVVVEIRLPLSAAGERLPVGEN